jgi:hypothetical protein
MAAPPPLLPSTGALTVDPTVAAVHEFQLHVAVLFCCDLLLCRFSSLTA